MVSTKDYSQLTRDELASEAKKLKAQKVPVAVFIGFLVGIAVWSATHQGGFFLTVGLLIFALVIGSSYSKKVKSVQAEISRRGTVH
jgi:uncharacterized membrane protein YbjE (DUF340 family)